MHHNKEVNKSYSSCRTEAELYQMSFFDIQNFNVNFNIVILTFLGAATNHPISRLM